MRARERKPERLGFDGDVLYPTPRLASDDDHARLPHVPLPLLAHPLKGALDGINPRALTVIGLRIAAISFWVSLARSGELSEGFSKGDRAFYLCWHRSPLSLHP